MKLSYLVRPADTVNRKIFRATLIVGSLTLAVRLAGTLKELIVARCFGRGDEVDAFLIAFLLPSFALTIGMSALGSALVPVFIEVRQKEGSESANQLFSSTMLLGVGALLALAALLGVFARIYLPALGRSFSPAKLDLTRHLLYLLLPWVLFAGIAALATAALNANERFALPALTPFLTPVVTLAFVLSEWRHWGVFTLVLGTAAGSALEAGLLLYLLKRHGIHFFVLWKGFDPELRRVLTQYAPMLAGGVLM